MICAVGAFVGCKPKSRNASVEAKADTVSVLSTDSIVFSQTADSTLECKIVVDYPIGNDSLSMEVRNYIARELWSRYLPLVNDGAEAKKYPMYSGKLDNGKAIVDYYGKGIMAYLKEQSDEMRGEGIGELPGMSSDVSIRKTDDNSRYITYESTQYAYLGGAHGSTFVYSSNISKATGKVLEQSVDTLKLEAMQPMLRKGVLSYMHEGGEKSVNEKNLGDYLFIENGIIPLPSTTPYLAKDGVHFVYQQYEIGPYAMGLISFTVPYSEIKPYLTKEALKLVE